MTPVIIPNDILKNTSIWIRIAIELFLEFKMASQFKANYYILSYLETCNKLDKVSEEVSKLRKNKWKQTSLWNRN